jgi:DNA-binding transcriptional regulator PaaX
MEKPPLKLLKLPTTAAAVLTVIRYYADDRGTATISRRQFAETIGCSEQGVRISIKRLVEAGLIEIEYNLEVGGATRTNIFRLLAED